MAVAVTSNARRAFRIGGRPLGAAGIARAVEHFVELGFEHGVQELTGSIPQASFNRVEPVVEKGAPQFVFPTAARQLSCYGSSWRNLRRHESAGIACWTKLEIMPPSNSNHSRYGTTKPFQEFSRAKCLLDQLLGVT